MHSLIHELRLNIYTHFNFELLVIFKFNLKKLIYFVYIIFYEQL